MTLALAFSALALTIAIALALTLGSVSSQITTYTMTIGVAFPNTIDTWVFSHTNL